MVIVINGPVIVGNSVLWRQFDGLVVGLDHLFIVALAFIQIGQAIVRVGKGGIEFDGALVIGLGSRIVALVEIKIGAFVEDLGVLRVQFEGVVKIAERGV